MGREDEIVKERIKKIDELKANGINPYPQVDLEKDSTADLQKEFIGLKNEEFGRVATVAGRIMSIRDMGKIAFAALQDSAGKIQIVLQDGQTPEKQSEIFRKFVDVGDILAVTGEIFRTKRGELSILVNKKGKLEILTKSVKPIPDQFYGLQDKEERYRKRYIDLIMSPNVKDVFEKRAVVVDTIRAFLKENKFTEVETPALQAIPGGASARPFKTHLNALNIDLYMAISPELYLKRLIAGGFERVFTMCKNFRNEGIDAFHNPEFTMLEFYYAYTNYEKLIKMTEELFERFKKELKISDDFEYQGKKINLKTPFKRVKFKDLILEKTGIDIDKANNFDKLKKEIESKKLKDVDIKKCKHYGALLDELYKRVVRPSIIQPTFLTHYPVEMIALAKRNEKDLSKINSFQLLIDGAELVKAYDELNDPIDQENRLKEQAKLKGAGDEEAMPMDDDFVNALKIGMPPTAGYGMGIDRITIFLANQPSIRDVILFPFMRPNSSSSEILDNKEEVPKKESKKKK